MPIQLAAFKKEQETQLSHRVARLEVSQGYQNSIKIAIISY